MPPGPAGNSISIQTGPVPDFLKLLSDDPFYKQSQEHLTGARDTSLLQTGQAEALDVGLFNADKELSERNNRQRERYLREFAASRGMVDSGQLGADQSERMFQFANLMGQKQMQQDSDITNFGHDRDTAKRLWAEGNGKAYFEVFNRLRSEGRHLAPSEMAVWDEESQLYVTKGGQYYDAAGQKASWNRNQSFPGPQNVIPPGYEAPVYGAAPTDPGFYESDVRSRPYENVIPGAAWGYE